MNKQEFMNTFQRAMDALGVTDQTAHYSFFDELFDDMAEEGVSEAEISERLGNPWELAASLLREELGTGEAKRPEAPRTNAQITVSEPQPRTGERQGANADTSQQEPKFSGKWNWRDGLNKLLNSAGVKLVINSEQFGGGDSFDTLIPSAGIEELEIHWMAGDLEIGAEEREDILLTEERSESASPMLAEVRGSCLCVFFTKNGSAFGSKDLTVTLPTELANGLRRCTVQTLSADVSMAEMYVRELYVKTASGEQEIRAMADKAAFSSASGDISLELDVRELTVSTASGELELTVENAETAKLSSASGDISCRGSVQRLSVNSASGDVEFSGEADRVQAKTASGDCSLDLDKEPEELNISSVSGDVEVTLPHGVACHLQLNSRTGDVSFSGIRTDVTDAPTYRVQTVSGDIDIHD